MFNSARLALARRRRGLTKKELAGIVGITARALTAYEADEYPPAEDVLARLADALEFPAAFFCGDDLDEPDESSVSFRSMKRMTASQRHAALAAGALAFALSEWVEKRFSLPESELPNLQGEEPETAAEIVRQEWGLGQLSVAHMVRLLEAKGVRVFSLVENARQVDAFSLWRGNRPYVFLNTLKSSAHNRYDAAHELAHLVLHKHGAAGGQDAEKEANSFAAAFLMPRASVLAAAPRFATVPNLIQLKKKWLVSVSALARRLRELGLASEWHYRTLCVQISERGYRITEPDDPPRETSRVWEKVLGALRQEGVTKDHIADDLAIPPAEIEKLVWGLATIGLSSPTASHFRSDKRATLRLVK
ncbi:MAG TPA: ImmA/IrrE family metallo-endopeptidase [Stellaceae bacterium]|nr:ImmA/IrrE family metallo-endopeptidase [Stellaceae bacterium]